MKIWKYFVNAEHYLMSVDVVLWDETFYFVRWYVLLYET